MTMRFLIVGVTLLCLGFNTYTDIRRRETNTVSIYTACLLICALRPYSFHSLLITVAGALFRKALAYTFRNYIGAGDFDVLFLIWLSGGTGTLLGTVFWSGVGLTAWSIPLLLCGKITIRSRFAYVPFLTLGYILQTLIGAV